MASKVPKRDTTFQPGNQFWQARSSHGRNPIFKDAQELWGACVEYFEWVKANPLQEVRGFAFRGKVAKENFPKLRAMSLDGLCLFLGVARQTWQNYRQQTDFLAITTQVEAAIRTQKFEGASAELLNASIIARDLGMVDKRELSGPDGGPISIQRIERVVVDPTSNSSDTDR